MKSFILISIMFCFVIATAVNASQAPLSIENTTFYTESYPPANYIENGKIKGLSVDTLKAMWKHLNMAEQEIFVVPWARGYRFTLDNPNTVLFTMSRTPSRDKLFKWVGPIFNSTHVLIAKKSKGFKFEHLGQTFDYSVATVTGDISEISLQQVGFPTENMANISTLEQAYLMTKADRVDMFVISMHGFNHLSSQLNIDQNDFEVVWEINTIGNYFAFNINTPDEIIQSYQNAFDQIKKQRLKIKSDYE
ncbi:substrate-binding periplasmic protein [Colwellia echini]|uniref:ABC transporter substrate-binding protein n=1 Tax=Colwellia echini TaxID=1982103 RepID=A0ABY3N093_9GAMM|nr:transporter substrate-binding domain-containing protein [Colwellia echini]TYK66890.1 ABC transporter substrate-binding protein [Colwellia echini]